jgi:hypothetical protein
LLVTLWLYASSGHRLIAPEISPGVVKSLTRRICVAPIMSVVAIAGSFADVWLGKAVFLAIPWMYLSHRFADMGWSSAGQPPEAE